MKRLIIAIVMLLTFSTLYARNERDTLGIGTAVSFTENIGQWHPDVRYEAQLHDAALFLHDDGMTVVLRSHVPHPAPQPTAPRLHAYRMTFGGSHGTMPESEGKQPGYSNYFLGNNPGRWRSHVDSYSVLRYRDIWPGIDMEIYTASNALKYNFIVHPGADPTQIVLEYEGTDGVQVQERSGNMIIRTSVRDIVESKPYVYQVYGAGEHRERASHWKVRRQKERHIATLDIGDYDPSRDLVVDPVLVFSTYTGSTADNWGTTAAYDSHKNTYTAGLVFNIGYPTSLGALDDSFNGTADIGIFKFDTLGSQRLFATYLGGAQADMPHSLFVNAFDQLLIFGTTGSNDFPVTAGAYQTTHAGGTQLNYENTSTIPFPNGSDIFVSRLSADGSQLQASTYIGGSGNDGLNYRQRYNSSYLTIMAGNDSLYYNYGDGARGEIITDDLNNVYIGSTTESADFPTTEGSLSRSWHLKQDGVVMKLDHNLRTMLWSTYLGGTGDDAVYSIDVDSAYNLLVCGGTNSNNFPTTTGAYQRNYGGGTADGFVSKISSDGSRLMASTYVGANLYDQLYFVRTGRHDEVFLFGQTKATGTTMIYNAGYSVTSGGMLLMRMLPDLSARRWSTVFGTPGRVNLSPTAFAADICNRVYAAGWGRDFVGYNGVQWYTAGTHGMEVTTDAYQDTTDGQDFYIISLDADANTLEYATFFGELHHSGTTFGGGDHVDGGTSRFDRLATLYESVCGSCGGTNAFPTTASAWSDSNRSSNCNNAVFRFEVTDDYPVAEFVAPEVGCAPYILHLNNTGRGTSFLWNFGDGTTSTERNPTHTYTAGGIYVITLIASMPGGCSEADTQRHTVQVLSQQGSMQTPRLSCNGARIQIGPTPQLGATYQWISGTVSDATVANPWVTDEGTYVLRVSGAGCSQTDTFVVQTYNLVASYSLGAVSCHDSADGLCRLVLDASVDIDSITCTIAPPATSHRDGQSAIVFDSLAPGSYRLIVSGYGCSYEETFTINNPDRPHYTKQTSTPLCSDSCTGWLHITYDYSVIPEQPSRDTLRDGLCEGTYITHLITSDGCPLVDTTAITRDHSLDGFHAWADTNTIYLGESVGLHASLSSKTESVGYTWSPNSDLDDPTSTDPTATPSDTLVCYTVTATSSNGCTATDTVCIHCTTVICGAPLFTIPNAFTPNGDGINDRVCFNTDEVVEFHIAIFNRWGERIYESDDASQCWDGTYRGNMCIPGVYTYTCHIRCYADLENDFKGDITLIR